MMLGTKPVDAMTLEFASRPKRLRHDSGSRHYDSSGCGSKSLELQGVIKVLKEYDDYDGGVNCSICGKLYKSRVCFIKHIWEHSVYWEQFEGAKNQERVLSIQAALILYSGYHGVAMDDDNILSHLMVTAPPEKKKDDNGNDIESPLKLKVERRQLSPLKRKKSMEEE
ncbi:uncharacterized protein LOC135464970 [Liolophura sinensis]|uniref:uncharacterized protein LOC135464970 n=1 Tax=Liolophura sinensis TaxID=3198878 RepID=UPI00315804EE